MSLIQYHINAETTIGILTVNRPEVRNALNFEAQEKFAEAINYFKDQKDLRVLLIRGAGEAFISGADLNELQMPETDGHKLAEVMGDALGLLQDMSAISIAVINGPARGGGAEVAVACDLRLMAEDASIAFVHAKLGLIPGWGGGEKLFRLVGEAKALELIATTKVIKADEAFQIGMVNQVFPADALMEKAMEMAERIANNQPESISAIKKLFHNYQNMSSKDARNLEREKFIELWDSDMRRNIFSELNKK